MKGVFQMLKKMFMYPSKNLLFSIPLVLIVGFLSGIIFDTGFLRPYILLMTVLMIYPTMIGIHFKETFSRQHGKVLLYAHLINFLLIPFIAYFIGVSVLSENPNYIAGLVLAALLPTSGMTISWTVLYHGNIPAAVKLTVTGLLLGALLTPWYLLLLVGQIVPVDILDTFKTIFYVIIIPLVAGNISYNLLLRYYTTDEFKTKIKPMLPAASVWVLLAIIFTSISLKSKIILANPQVLVTSLIALFIFYALNFLISTIAARLFLEPKDGISLIYGTVMRNLSLALGLAITNFGPDAALIITLAFIIQVQGAAWYGTLSKKLNFLGKLEPTS